MAGHLEAIIRERVTRPVVPEIQELASVLQQRYGSNLLAVLAYGSCLRGVSLDDGLVDLYALISAYEAAHENIIATIANRLLPPNVYYLQHHNGGKTVRAKYALITLSQFERKLSAETSNPYFWARFAQPCALLFAKDRETENTVTRALAGASRTMISAGRAMASADADPASIWTKALEATYATELRPESTRRAGEIVQRDLIHYQAVMAAIGTDTTAILSGPQNWRWRRMIGKSLSVLRLIKAAFTFQGGADYIVWKIKRHSDVDVELSPWQRRHPILAAAILFPKLYFKGGFR